MRRRPRLILLLPLGVLLSLSMAGYFRHRHHTPEAYRERGFALENQGRYRAAIGQFREAARFRLNEADAHYWVGNALMNSNDRLTTDARHQAEVDMHLPSVSQLSEAIAEYQRAEQLKPADFEYHYSLAGALSNQGDVKDAITEYRVAIRLLPKTAEVQIGPNIARDNSQTLSFAYHCLASELAADKQYPEAIKQYRQSLMWEPLYDDNVRLELADALDKAGRRDEARAEWKNLVATNSAEAKTAREMLEKNPL